MEDTKQRKRHGLLGHDTVKRAVFLPFPKINPTESRPQDAKQQLTAIVTNLRQNQIAVRNNLLTLAHQRSRTLPTPPPPASIDHQADNTYLIASLTTPHKDGSGDPGIKPAPYVRRHDPSQYPSPLDNPSPTTKTPTQTVTPPAVKLASNLLDAMDEYDAHAGRTRAYYQRALDMSSFGGSGAIVQSPIDMAGSPGFKAAEGSMGSAPAAQAPVAEMRRGSGSGSGSAAYDRARDPRLRR